MEFGKHGIAAISYNYLVNVFIRFASVVNLLAHQFAGSVWYYFLPISNVVVVKSMFLKLI